MTQLRDDELSKLTKLCRIECSEEERIKLASNISKILSYIDLLQEVETKEVPPCVHITEHLSTITREDKIETTLSREEFFSNAPSHIGGMIRVPPIINSSK